MRCLRCRRILTTTEARLYRLGSRCRHTTPVTPPRGHVDQDELPGLTQSLHCSPADLQTAAAQPSSP